MTLEKQYLYEWLLMRKHKHHAPSNIAKSMNVSVQEVNQAAKQLGNLVEYVESNKGRLLLGIAAYVPVYQQRYISHSPH